MAAKIGVYTQGCNFILTKTGIQPIPSKYQTGLIRFSNNPTNSIKGIEKLDTIKTK